LLEAKLRGLEWHTLRSIGFIIKNFQPSFVCNVKDDQREQVKKLSIIIVILMNNWVQGNSVVPENVPPAIN